MTDAPRLIPRLFRAAVDEVSNKVWLLAGERTWTYGEAMEQIERAASRLRAQDIAAGDRVLVTARNTPEYLFAWFALMECGAVQVPINPASSGAEIAGFVAQVEPTLVITDGELAPSFDASRAL